MKEIPIAKAKAKFAELVQAASRGEPVTITVRGKPLAILGPVAEVPREAKPMNGGELSPTPPYLNMTLAALLRSMR